MLADLLAAYPTVTHKRGSLLACMEAVGKRFGGVEITNGDHEAGPGHRTPP
jgi:hypothetical protein